MRRGIYLFWAFASLASCATAPSLPPEPLADDGTPCIADRDAFMAMDYWTFDQDPDGSRTVFAKPGCELAGADLVRDYHAALREKGEPVTHAFPQGTITFSETGEVAMLYWHEGQVRAFEGQTELAIRLFEKTIAAGWRNNAGNHHYALATIAFLKHDYDSLMAERAGLAGSVKPGDLNLGVVDGLIACFDRSYKDAYGTVECDRRPGRQSVTP